MDVFRVADARDRRFSRRRATDILEGEVLKRSDEVLAGFEGWKALRIALPDPNLSIAVAEPYESAPVKASMLAADFECKLAYRVLP